jgi:hypothetical protein
MTLSPWASLTARRRFNGGALTVGDYKLIIGLQSLSFWQGPAYPNGARSPGCTRHSPLKMTATNKQT